MSVAKTVAKKEPTKGLDLVQQKAWTKVGTKAMMTAGLTAAWRVASLADSTVASKGFHLDAESVRDLAVY